MSAFGCGSALMMRATRRSSLAKSANSTVGLAVGSAVLWLLRGGCGVGGLVVVCHECGCSVCDLSSIAGWWCVGRGDGSSLGRLVGLVLTGSCAWLLCYLGVWNVLVLGRWFGPLSASEDGVLRFMP